MCLREFEFNTPNHLFNLRNFQQFSDSFPRGNNHNNDRYRMHVSVRSYLNAGVALAGAGIIAVTPVTPVAPALHDIQVPTVHTADVQLSALLNPLEVFAPIVEQAMANSQVIGQKVMQSPLPVLQALALNQLDSLGTLAGLGTDVAQALAALAQAVPGNFQTAIGQFQAGNIDQALRTIEEGFVSPFVPLVMADLPKLVNVLKRPLVDAQVLIENLPISYLVGAAFPVLNSFYAAQTQIINGITGVADALSTGNPEKIANAITTGAANLTQELLNGNPATNTHGLLGLYGPINGLLDANAMLAYFLRPPAEFSALNAAPNAAVSPVTLAIRSAVTAPVPAAAGAVKEVATQAEATGTSEGAQSTEGTEATKGTEDAAASDDGAADTVSTTRATEPTGGNKVVPGQIRHDSASAGSGTSSTSVRDGITKTVKGMTDGLKKAARNVTGGSGEDSASASPKASDSSSTSRGNGGKHRATK
ncbi:hypothetical protein [Mycobacterium sp. NPDC050441]|uniref:hypothetical protein n=1 Tax=Mycobacterium sp. NPDC050441 TaxID=3155403 RepID=UPI0034061536